MSPSLQLLARVTPRIADAACPSCRYQRTGLRIDRECPECGSSGLHRSVVVLGSTRTGRLSYALLLVIVAVLALVLAACFLAAIFGHDLEFGVRLQSRFLSRVPAVMHVGALASLAVLARLLWQRISRAPISIDAPVPRGGIAWIAHPFGLEVREPGHARWISSEVIARVRARDRWLGRSTRLEVIFRKSSLRGMLHPTTVLYLRGTRAERRAIEDAVTETMGLPPMRPGGRDGRVVDVQVFPARLSA